MRATCHTAKQADGVSKLASKGEVHIIVTRGNIKFLCQAIVVERLDTDILGGMPFFKTNKIVLDVPNDTVIVNGKHYINYLSDSSNSHVVVRRCESFLVRSSEKQVVYPGEFLEVKSPDGVVSGESLTVEPRTDVSENGWINPCVIRCVGDQLRIPNLTEHPVCVKKNQHLVQVCRVSENSDISKPEAYDSDTATFCSPTPPPPFSKNIIVDPDNLWSVYDRKNFVDLHLRYDNVFNPRIGCYNDASGPLRAHINIGSVEPPVNKCHIPSYNQEKLRLLQNKMDELEDLGVLARPEDIGINVEHVSPSFLVKKPNSGDYRLVTAFNSVAAYAKSVPTKASSCDDVLRFIARHRYIIKSDMTKQFFQLRLTKASQKYVGTMTPFKGLRVYVRAAMGMPGSTEHLDELVSRILGDMIADGNVMKIADDLYVGADSPSELLKVWEELLRRMEANNLRLSGPKTLVNPQSTPILGWKWSQGKISPLPHRISPLCSAEPPKTVKLLRSWCGAVKFLKACIPQYSLLLSDLESATAGKDSTDKIQWSEELLAAFSKAKEAVKRSSIQK